MADNADIQARLSREMARLEYQLATLREIYRVGAGGGLSQRTLSSLLKWLESAAAPVHAERDNLQRLQAELRRGALRSVRGTEGITEVAQ